MKHTSRTRFSVPELGVFTRGWATAITCRKNNHLFSNNIYGMVKWQKWHTSKIYLLKHINLKITSFLDVTVYMGRWLKKEKKRPNLPPPKPPSKSSIPYCAPAIYKVELF